MNDKKSGKATYTEIYDDYIKVTEAEYINDELEKKVTITKKENSK